MLRRELCYYYSFSDGFIVFTFTLCRKEALTPRVTRNINSKNIFCFISGIAFSTDARCNLIHVSGPESGFKSNPRGNVLLLGIVLGFSCLE